MPDQSPAPGSGRDITILVPAYQCAGQLAEHSRSLQKYRDLGCPVMWVVSPSPDGSEKVAEQICKETGDRLLLSPPGLYESWNFGIARVETEFVAVSTIGDHYLNTGLIPMADQLRKTGADLCFSPPRAVDAKGRRNRQLLQWPVFRFQQRLEQFHGEVCRPEVLVAMQLASGLSCLLGSWAGVLARTASLRTRPFPTDHGHYGDTAWFYRQLPRLRICFFPKAVAGFVFHPRAGERRPGLGEPEAQYRRLAVNLLRDCALGGIDLDGLPRLFRRFYSSWWVLNRRRGCRPRRFWWLRPDLLYLRFLRNYRETVLTSHQFRTAAPISIP